MNYECNTEWATNFIIYAGKIVKVCEVREPVYEAEIL